MTDATNAADYYPNNDIDEFCGILKCLDDIELVILHQALLLDEPNQKRFIFDSIRKNLLPQDGKIINAYYAKVLVSDPIVYIKEENIVRFHKNINIHK
uniref:Uncharacterized protein n=1 Tax=viral metagenome TaxID=1070528 RepID=A0A6C0HGA4_9ZZZZ